MKTLNEYTLQEIYDTIIEGFEKQDWKLSVNARGSCKYRGPNGVKCAVGMIIPDECYAKSIEGLSVHTIFNMDLNTSRKLKPFITMNDYGKSLDICNFLTQMQVAHDEVSDYHSCSTQEEIKNRLKKEFTAIAKNWDLNV